LGLGERAGNAALDEVVMGLKHLRRTDPGVRSELLPRLSAVVARAAGREIPAGKPVVGAAVFAHESGIHAAGVLKRPETYEPFPPEEVGRRSEIVLGKHSGRAAVAHRLAGLGIDLEEDRLSDLLGAVRRFSSAHKRPLGDDELARLCGAGMTRW
jgi:homocitrate synthase NifV